MAKCISVDATWPRGRGRPKNYTWKRDLEKDVWTSGCKNSWRKMEVAAQNRADDKKELYVAYVSRHRDNV